MRGIALITDESYAEITEWQDYMVTNSGTDKVRYAETHMRLESIGRSTAQARIEKQPQRIAEADEVSPAEDSVVNEIVRPAKNAEVDGVPERSPGRMSLQIDNYAEQRNGSEQRPELDGRAKINSARQGAEVRGETAFVVDEEMLAVPERPKRLVRGNAERTADETGGGEIAEIEQLRSEMPRAGAAIERGYLPEAASAPDVSRQPERSNAKPFRRAAQRANAGGRKTGVAPEVAQQDTKGIWPFGRRGLQERLDAEEMDFIAEQRRARELRINMKR